MLGIKKLERDIIDINRKLERILWVLEEMRSKKNDSTR
tara:strand:- start:2066 stop:2179 length:114 start_codon:yes stop_codon:yes gene_type:complete